MPNGRSAWITLLAILLLAPAFPLASAAPPTAFGTVQSTGGQTLSDLALDPTGQFAAAVVDVGAGGALPSCSPALPTCPLPSHDQIYSCDFAISAAGCRGATHTKPMSTAAKTNTRQTVDVVTVQPPGSTSVAQYFGVAGPGDLVSFWSEASSAPLCEYALGAGSVSTSPTPLATDVAVAPDARHVLFAANLTTGLAGTLTYYAFDSTASSPCTYKWSYSVLDAQQQPTHVTALAWARGGSLVAFGTPSGFGLLAPTDAPPQTTDDLHYWSTSNTTVNAIALSAAGDVVAAATNGYTVFGRIDPATSRVTVPAYTFSNAGNVQAVALTQDGERFASASGSLISFFHASHDAHIAIPDGSYDAGALVTDLSYDSTGRILVAAAGGNVLGFSPGRATPVWTLDAATAGVDAPFLRARVADGWHDGAFHPAEDATRLVVAGATKVAAFDLATQVRASLAAPNGAALVPTVPVALAVSVTNTGSLTDNFTFVVQPPMTTTSSPWSVAAAPGLRLDPDATGVSNFSVTAPSGQAPGTYAVTVEVHAQNYNGRPACGTSPDTLACATVNLTLARSVVLSVGGPDDRRLLKAGGEDTIPLTITNLGNALGVVNLTATQTLSRGTNWAVRFTPAAQVNVPAGQSVSVNAILDVPNDALSGDRNVVTVIAKEGMNATATKSFTAYVDPQFGSDLNATNASLSLAPGDQQTITLNVHNTGNTEDTYNLTFVVTPPSAVNDWRVTLAQLQVIVPPGQIKPVPVTIRPLVAQPTNATVTLTATSQGDPGASASSFVVEMVGKPLVPTPTTKSNPLPGPEPLLVVGLVALAALARRLRGSRP